MNVIKSTNSDCRVLKECKKVTKMPRVLVLSLGDLGSSYRLLRHIKSFANQPDTYVSVIGACNSVLPREIEKLANVRIYELFGSFNDLSGFSIFYLPFMFIFTLFYILILASKVGKVDFVLIQSDPLLSSYFFGLLLKLIKRCKLIVDIHYFKSVVTKTKNIFSYLENNLPKLCDILIVPTRSMQGSLQIRGIKSYIIRDNPGTLFRPSLELRSNICSLLNIDSDTGLIGVPFPVHNEQLLNSLIKIATSCNKFNKKLAFIIFGGGKSQRALEEKIKEVRLKNIKMFAMPLCADVYPQIMGACDLGLSLFGATFILDLTPELIEMEWCGVPIATKLYGCVREIISDSTGFFFRTDDELVEIINNVFVLKLVDIDSMREECKLRLVKWDKSWIDTFEPILNECQEK